MIYLDSCIVIYAAEDLTSPGQKARRLLGRPEERFLISPLVIHECLVGPLRRSDEPARARFESLFTQFEYVDLDLDAYLLAAALRAASSPTSSATTAKP